MKIIIISVHFYELCSNLELNTVPKKLLLLRIEGDVEGYIGRGRSRMEHMKQIIMNMGKNSYKELKELSYNREAWRIAANHILVAILNKILTNEKLLYTKRFVSIKENVHKKTTMQLKNKIPHASR
ncbi:craniofacial development protein 2-like [Aphis craccivora]|uniref:Craniofacial development protein 2-like n=1 Tax=Aphis craccivora TaxID=307492 RepID=A0A6G0YYQ5_APHCR|nr:craniofacial development protein 2-like [Aphis craccivora]